MKLAQQVLSQNEGIDSAIDMALESMKKSLGKELERDLGKSGADSFMRNLIDVAYVEGSMDKLIKALQSAKKEFEKGSKLQEAKHQNTKVRGVSEGFGSRKARLTVKEACGMLECLLAESKGAPYPKAANDEVYIKEALHMGKVMQEKIKSVKESKKKRK